MPTPILNEEQVAKVRSYLQKVVREVQVADEATPLTPTELKVWEPTFYVGSQTWAPATDAPESQSFHYKGIWTLCEINGIIHKRRIWRAGRLPPGTRSVAFYTHAGVVGELNKHHHALFNKVWEEVLSEWEAEEEADWRHINGLD